MCRVCRIVIVGLMARKAIGGSIDVIAIDMTSGAIVNIMSQRERKFTMIKSGRFPSRCGRMAHSAAGGEICTQMIWIGGGVIISLMARKAIGGSIGVISIYVTSGAIVNIVPLCKREKVVIKSCPFPLFGKDRMTVAALG